MERRTEKIRVRLTEEELEHLKKCSSSFSKAKFRNGRENFSEYLRAKLLAESNYKNKMIEQKMGELRYELRKIGTNVNQIAKKINSGFGSPNDIEELERHMDRIEQSIEKFREEVERAWQSQS